MPISTTYGERPGLDKCYVAIALVRERALRGDDSLFTPGTPIWRDQVIDDLYRRFVEQPDTSSDRFEVKFHRQLDGAPDSTIQLAAELLFIHLVIADDMTGATKRGLINEV